MTKRKIIIVDDEPMMSALIKELIDDEPDMEVSRLTISKEEFLQAVAAEPFDMALMDISVGEREGGLEILKALQERQINLSCIMLSAHDETSFALRCLKLGARGYVSKDAICSDLVNGLKQVAAGGLYISGPKAAGILDEYKEFLKV